MEKNTKNIKKAGSEIIVPDKSSNENEKVKYQTLVIQGDSYKTLLTKKYENRTKWVKPDVKNIYSFIPGTVTEIFVKLGQTLKKGDKLIMFEAMKMLNTIEMPVNGKIKNIIVSVGDRIPKGTLMIELE
jgi:biotin carboxyl carrier protein